MPPRARRAFATALLHRATRPPAIPTTTPRCSPCRRVSAGNVATGGGVCSARPPPRPRPRSQAAIVPSGGALGTDDYCVHGPSTFTRGRPPADTLRASRTGRLGVARLLLPTRDEADNLGVLVPELLALAPNLSSSWSSTTRRPTVRPRSFAGSARGPSARASDRAPGPAFTHRLRSATGLRPSRADLVGLDGRRRHDAAQRTSAALWRPIRPARMSAVGSRFIAGRARRRGKSREGSLGRFASLFALEGSRDGWLGVLLSWTLNRPRCFRFSARARPRDFTSGFAVDGATCLLELGLLRRLRRYFIDLGARRGARGSDSSRFRASMLPRVPGPVRRRRPTCQVPSSGIPLPDAGLPASSRAVTVARGGGRRTAMAPPTLEAVRSP